MHKLWGGWGMSVLVGLGVVVASLGVFVAFSFSSLRGHYIVTLRDAGFHPEEITIRKDDTITFTSQTGKEPFWPASDIHPTHGIYPEFDPKKSVPAGESWSFRT